MRRMLFTLVGCTAIVATSAAVVADLAAGQVRTNIPDVVPGARPAQIDRITIACSGER